MSHDWIKKNTGGFCVGVFGEGGAGGWVSERKLLKEYHQCGKGAEQAIRHSRWPSNLVPKLRPRFATFASTQTHEGPPKTCVHANTQKTCRCGGSTRAYKVTHSCTLWQCRYTQTHLHPHTLFLPSVLISISLGWEMVWNGSMFWSLVWTHGVLQWWKMRVLSHGHLFF